MRFSRTDLLPVLTIVAGGVIGASLSIGFLGSRSDDVPVRDSVVRIEVNGYPDGTGSRFLELEEQGLYEVRAYAIDRAEGPYLIR